MKNVALVILLLILTACSGGGSSSSSPGDGNLKSLMKIEITPFVSSLVVNTSLSLNATGIYSDNSTEDITQAVEWKTDDQSVAVITEGTLNAVGAGVVQIKASQNGIVASVIFRIVDAELVNLTANPSFVTLPVYEKSPIRVTGTFSDNTCQDMTNAVIFSTQNSGVADVDNDLNIIAHSTGSTVITASKAGVTVQIPVTVTPAMLQRIELSPDSLSLPSGSIKSFVATGIYSDSTKRDLTQEVSWSSSNSATAQIVQNNTSAVMTALSAGSTDITATFETISASAHVTVTDAILSRIDITPGQISLAKGLTQNYKAIGFYSDNTSKDITDKVLWKSSDENLFLISNNSSSKGLCKALATGTGTVTAQLDDVSSTSHVQVSDAIIQQLVVSADFTTLPKGMSKIMTASGLYSDNTIRDLTQDVTWSTSNQTYAVCQNGNNKGLLTGLQPGIVTVSAQMGDLNDSLAVTIQDAILQRIEITPNTASIAAGYTFQFTALGIYSDNTVSDITSNVVWQSSDTNVAVPDNSLSLSGQYKALIQGEFTVNASTGSITSGITAQVTAATLTNLFITPEQLTVTNGLTYQFKVSGIFSDSSIVDLTSSVIWQIDNNEIMKIQNTDGEKGIGQAIGVGTCTISTSYSGKVAESHVTVSDVPLDSIDIELGASSMAAGTSIQLSATGHYHDGTTRDLTHNVLWASSSNTILSISNDKQNAGYLNSHTAGTAQISATYGGVSTNMTVTVTQAVLTMITVQIGGSTLPTGITQNCNAIGTFSDMTTQDITQSVVWTSGDNTIARISNLNGAKGLLSTFASGTTSITASTGSVSGSAALTVTGATLTTLKIIPGYACIDAVSSVSMKLQGKFSDNSVRDLTAQALWVIRDSNVASISNEQSNEGRLSGVSPGNTLVAAIYGNIGVIAPVYVLKPVESITITYDTLGVPVGWILPLKATATYDDGTTGEVTGRVFWSSSNTAVADFSDFGEIAGLSSGQADITVSVNGSVYHTVTVNVVIITSMQMSYSLVAEGIQFTVIGIAGSYLFNLTNAVTWSSDNEAVLTISNDTGKKGLGTPLSVGSATVSASYNNGELTISKLLTIGHSG